jgi:hypothetical protein
VLPQIKRLILLPQGTQAQLLRLRPAGHPNQRIDLLSLSGKIWRIYSLKGVVRRKRMTF